MLILRTINKHLPVFTPDILGKVYLFCVLLSAVIPFAVVFLSTSRSIKLIQIVVITSLSIQTFFSWLLFVLYRDTGVEYIAPSVLGPHRAEFVKIPLNFLPNSVELTWILLLDSVGSSFVLLTSFIMLLCFVYIFASPAELFSRGLILLLLIINFNIINFFLAGDLFFMFFFYEGVLFPLFLLIGLFGSRERKIVAALHTLFLYFYWFNSYAYMLYLLIKFSWFRCFIYN